MWNAAVSLKEPLVFPLLLKVPKGNRTPRTGRGGSLAHQGQGRNAGGVGWGGGAWKAGQPLKAGEQESRWWETCEDL